MAMGAESDGARVISPTTRCSVCAARSAASASRSSLLRAACISSSSVRVLRACCIIAVDRAVHFRNAARSLRHARQPQAFHGAGLGSDIQGARSASSVLAGSSEATWAMAVLSRRAASSGVSVTGAGSEAWSVWTT
jgi:hypothetical protein